MKQRIYTDGFNFMENYIEVEATDITVNQVLGSKDEITMKVESETAIAFNLGYCYAPTHSTTGVYLLNELPSYEKKSEFKHIYNLTFQGLMHDLSKIAFTGTDNECEFFYNGRAIDFVTMIVARMASAKAASDIVSTWYVGNTESQGLTDTTGFKNIQFSNQNCWQALNSICDEFEFEFEFGRMGLALNTVVYLSIKKLVGNWTGTTIAYGKPELGQAGGIRNIKRTNVNVDKLITRLFYLGSDQNLPSDYTGGTRLKGTTDYKSLNVDTYGRRDGFQTFEDIKPSFTGTVTSFDINSEKENILVAPFPFDLLEVDSNGDTKYLIGGTTAKIVFLTGDCAGYTFDILDKGFDWDGTNATISLIKYTDEAGNEWPNLTVKPKASNTFTIVDIRMPGAYLDNAITSLDVAAQDYLVKYSTPRVQYTIETDPKYCSQNDISYKIGDKMIIDDSDLNISETCRVIETSYKLYDRYNATIKLSDVRFAIPTRKVKSQLKQLEVFTRATKATSVTKILKSQKTTNELKTSILDVNDNKFNTERVRNESLDPVGLAYDSGEVQYSMKETKLKSTEAGIEYTDGIVVHHSFNAKTRAEIKKLQKNGLTYSPTRTWTLAAGSSEVAANKSAYIYLKLPLLAAETAATIFTSETHLWAKSQTNYILYKLGSVGAVVEGKRELSVLWGGGGHLPVTLDPNSSNELYVDEANQIIGIDLSAYAKTANLHPAVSLGAGSETELALNPATQVLTLTGLKKTFLSLNDTFDAYPTQGYGNGLIAGTSAVNYSNSFGVDGTSFWVAASQNAEQEGSSDRIDLGSWDYFTLGAGWSQNTQHSSWFDYTTGGGLLTTNSFYLLKNQGIDVNGTEYILFFALTTGTANVYLNGPNGTIQIASGVNNGCDFSVDVDGNYSISIEASQPCTLTDINISYYYYWWVYTYSQGIRVVNSSHQTQVIYPTHAGAAGDVCVLDDDAVTMIFKPLSESLTGVILDTDFPAAGLMLTDGAGNYSVITDNSATWNTALVDADFPNNGLMVRTGAGAYSTVADNSATWNTLASLGTKTFWNGTQAAYDAIGTKDSNTIYFINV